MLVRLDSRSSEPLYVQIAGQVRGSITSGDLAHGERLPTARELAGVLDVNVHTVLRAYAELREEGLIEMRRGRGVTVCAAEADRSQLMQLVRELAVEGRRHGLTAADLHRLLEKA